MITHIRGLLVAKTSGTAVIETAGLGYGLSISLTTFMVLPEPPAEIMLLTSLFIREDAWDLYGFATELERSCFSALTSVNRIGPKLALTVLSSMEPLDLAKALMTKDLKAMSSIKGIGVKTAERLLMELKDKAPKLAALAGVSKADFKPGDPCPPDGPATTEDDVVSALVNLGYSPAEAEKASATARREAEGDSNLGFLLKLALKNLTKTG